MRDPTEALDRMKPFACLALVGCIALNLRQVFQVIAAGHVADVAGAADSDSAIAMRIVFIVVAVKLVAVIAGIWALYSNKWALACILLILVGVASIPLGFGAIIIAPVIWLISKKAVPSTRY